MSMSLFVCVRISLSHGPILQLLHFLVILTSLFLLIHACFIFELISRDRLTYVILKLKASTTGTSSCQCFVTLAKFYFLHSTSQPYGFANFLSMMFFEKRKSLIVTTLRSLLNVWLVCVLFLTKMVLHIL